MWKFSCHLAKRCLRKLSCVLSAKRKWSGQIINAINATCSIHSGRGRRIFNFMPEELKEGDIVKHKLEFDILVMEICPRENGWSFEGIRGYYEEEGKLVEGFFRWCEFVK
jgi:hypothetical protein